MSPTNQEVIAICQEAEELLEGNNPGDLGRVERERPLAAQGNMAAGSTHTYTSDPLALESTKKKTAGWNQRATDLTMRCAVLLEPHHEWTPKQAQTARELCRCIGDPAIYPTEDAQGQRSKLIGAPDILRVWYDVRYDDRYPRGGPIEALGFMRNEEPWRRPLEAAIRAARQEFADPVELDAKPEAKAKK